MNGIFLGLVEASRVGGWCHVRRGGLPGNSIREFRMLWSHTAMDFSDWPHMDMVDLSGFPQMAMVWQRCVCLRKDVNCARWLFLTGFWVDVCRV